MALGKEKPQEGSTPPALHKRFTQQTFRHGNKFNHRYWFHKEVTYCDTLLLYTKVHISQTRGQHLVLNKGILKSHGHNHTKDCILSDTWWLQQWQSSSLCSPFVWNQHTRIKRCSRQTDKPFDLFCTKKGTTPFALTRRIFKYNHMKI